MIVHRAEKGWNSMKFKMSSKGLCIISKYVDKLDDFQERKGQNQSQIEVIEKSDSIEKVNKRSKNNVNSIY